MSTTTGRRGSLLTLVLLLAIVAGAIMAPNASASALGIGRAGGAIAIATIGSISATALFGLRVGVGGSAAFGLFMALSVLASGNAFTAVALMTAGGIAFALTASKGWHGGMVLYPIALGFATSEPALPADIGSALLAGVSAAVFGMLGAGAIWLMRSRLPAMPAARSLTSSRAFGYAALLAVATVATSTISVAYGLGHTGGWLIMTPFIVIQPFARDSWPRTLRRVVGTLAGFALASLLGFALADFWPVLHLVGVAFVGLMLWAKLNGKNYALYAAFVTTAVIILSSGGRGVQDIANHRLEATLAGVAISIAVILLGMPLAAWHLRRAGEHRAVAARHG